jgi:hypothetical protein
MPKIRDQATKRRGAIWKDQHGREWGGTMDKDTGCPIGDLIPVSGVLNKKRFGWKPRVYDGKDLIALSKYMIFDENRLSTFVIDYTTWRSDLEAAHKHWGDQAMHFAAQMYGDKAGEVLQDHQMPVALRNMVGSKPMPLVLIDAMEQGNEWILGLSNLMPEELAEFFPKPVAPVQRFAPKVKE